MSRSVKIAYVVGGAILLWLSLQSDDGRWIDLLLRGTARTVVLLALFTGHALRTVAYAWISAIAIGMALAIIFCAGGPLCDMVKRQRG